MRTTVLAALIALALPLAASAAQPSKPAGAIPANIAAAVADPARKADAANNDARRKGGELLAFAQVKPGQSVVDLIPGGGYFTHPLPGQQRSIVRVIAGPRRFVNVGRRRALERPGERVVPPALPFGAKPVAQAAGRAPGKGPRHYGVGFAGGQQAGLIAARGPAFARG